MLLLGFRVIFPVGLRGMLPLWPSESGPQFGQKVAVSLEPDEPGSLFGFSGLSVGQQFSTQAGLGSH